MLKYRIIISGNLKKVNLLGFFLKGILKKMKVKIIPPRKLEARLNRKLNSMLGDAEKSFKRLDTDIKFRDSITIGEIDSNFQSVINDIDREELKTWLELFYQDIYIFVLEKLKQPREFTKKEVDLMTYFVIQTLELFEVALGDFTKNVSYVLSKCLIEGTSIQELTRDLVKASHLSRQRAETIAITQTANANSRFARETFKRMNIKKVVWSSAKDKRVRKCHLARNGISYEIDKGCFSSCDGKHLQTGQEVRCRCAMIVELI